MGLYISSLFSLFEEWGSTESSVVMLGLDSAGKTTLLYKMKLNETVTTIPTIGFNVETVTPVKGLTFTVWDVGGQDKIRHLWKNYYKNAEGLIYVVDSADPDRLEESRQELFGVVDTDEMYGVPVLILANKHDLPGSLDCSEIVKRLNLTQLHGRRWYIQATCAVTGKGVFDALEHFADMVKDFKAKGGRKF